MLMFNNTNMLFVTQKCVYSLIIADICGINRTNMKIDHVSIPDDEEEKSALIEFFSKAKLEAFVNSFSAVTRESSADEVFNEIKLRAYFQAYPRPIGDVFTLYLEELSNCGFELQTSITGELALFVKYTTTERAGCLDLVFGVTSKGVAGRGSDFSELP